MRWAAALFLALLPRPAAAQGVIIGPLGALADYREVAASLRYNGSGFGGQASLRHDRWSAEAVVLRVTYDPASGSAATAGFKATQVDAWVAYDVASYASVEVGVTQRSVSPEFNATSVGAIRIGARSFSEIGPGATVRFRANYLAASKFSGGGRAPIALDLGVGLDVRLAGQLHGTAEYAFDRMNRKVDPGGTGEIDAPIQSTLARVGLALAF